MTKHTSHALRRADRVLVGTFVLVISFSSGIVLGHSTPSTEEIAIGAKQEIHKVAQATGAATDVAAAAVKSVGRKGYEAGSVVAEIPASVSTSIQAFGEPLSGVVTMPSVAELKMIRILENQRCLAEAMYYEARGEGRAGQEAIADVVFHRMRTPGYPHSICGVVYEGANLKHGCQFSFTCNGELQLPKSPGAWARARILAAKIVTGTMQLVDITGDAISFHSADIQPGWADHLERTIQIGNHVFYRAAPRTKAS